MKKTLTILISVVLSLNLSAQDSKFGLRLITEENRAEADAARAKITKFKLPTSHQMGDGELPLTVDNSTRKYFPPIISQIGSSCGPASMVGYQYTYEYNVLKDLSGADNRFGYLFNWNFQNDGSSGKGTFPWDVCESISNYGLPTVDVYDTKIATQWASGMNIFEEGYKYDVDYEVIVSDEVGSLEVMKQFLYDRGNGSPTGGLIQFSAFADPLWPDEYSGPSESNYSHIIPMFGTDGMHSMIIVGYDDTVWYDYNSNGNKEADEIGAFICVNTWGESWSGNSAGRFYAPYRTFSGAMFQGEGGIGNGGVKDCYMLFPKDKQAKLLAKMVVSHTSRDDIKIYARALDANGTSLLSQSQIILYAYKNAGGDYPMQGQVHTVKDKSYMEFMLDISELDVPGAVTFELEIRSYKRNNVAGKGAFISSSILDYRNGTEPKEYLGVIASPTLDHDVNSTAIYKLVPDANIVEYSTSLYNNNLYLSFSSPSETYGMVEIVDINGNVAYTCHADKIPAGVSSQVVELEGKIVPSAYYLRVNVNGEISYKKIVIE